MDDPRPVLIFVFLAGSGAVVALLRHLAETTDRGRVLARARYSDETLPHSVRNVVPLAPLIASAAFLMGTLVLLPRSLAAWLLIPVLVLLGVTFALSYRVPPPFMPAWLRREIEMGETPLARPDRLDWLVFWLALPVIALGPLAILVLNVVFGGTREN